MTTVTAAPPSSRMPRPAELVQFLRDEPALLRRLHARYGDVFQMKVERRPWTMLAHPDAIREVFRQPPDVLHAGDANEILKPALGPTSILVLDEAAHMRQRRLLLPAFHGERLKAQAAGIREVAERQVRRFPTGRPFSLRPHTQAIALEVIVRIVLGVEPDDPRHDAIEAPFLALLDWTTDTRNLVAPTLLGPDNGVVRRLQARVRAPVDRQLHGLIAERRAAADLAERTDVLSMLLLARDEEGEPMSDREIRDELVSLLVAGHETTATSLAWAYERLTRAPQTLRRLEDESRTPETTFAEAVAKETLRVRPVLMNVLRTVVQPVDIAGHRFPVGTVLAPSIYLVQRRPDVWGADADVFRPERWLDGDPPSYAWIPFGGGVRRCIGAAFAQLEQEIVLRAISGSVHLEPVGEAEAPVARFITSSPARGGEVRVAA